MNSHGQRGDLVIRSGGWVQAQMGRSPRRHWRRNGRGHVIWLNICAWHQLLPPPKATWPMGTKDLYPLWFHKGNTNIQNPSCLSLRVVNSSQEDNKCCHSWNLKDAVHILGIIIFTASNTKVWNRVHKNLCIKIVTKALLVMAKHVDTTRVPINRGMIK